MTIKGGTVKETHQYVAFNTHYGKTLIFALDILIH